MAIPRLHLVGESCSSLYHCISRTVRQAFLLALQSDGVVDGHRRDWVFERVRFLSEIFAVDCVSLAVMSNHLHLLLRTLPEVGTGQGYISCVRRPPSGPDRSLHTAS